MNRPGPAGLLVLLAFAVVFAVEFKTVLGMVGVEVTSTVYYPVVATLIAVAFAVLLFLPDGEGRQLTGT